MTEITEFTDFTTKFKTSEVGNSVSEHQVKGKMSS